MFDVECGEEGTEERWGSPRYNEDGDGDGENTEIEFKRSVRCWPGALIQK